MSHMAPVTCRKLPYTHAADFVQRICFSYGLIHRLLSGLGPERRRPHQRIFVEAMVGGPGNLLGSIAHEFSNTTDCVGEDLV